MTRPLCYVAHAVSGNPVEHCARAKRWLAWLWRTFPGVDFTAPWIPLVEAITDADPADRERGLALDERLVADCGYIVLVGSAVTDGMQREVDAFMREVGGCERVINLTVLGPEPPALSADEIGALIKTQVWT